MFNAKIHRDEDLGLKNFEFFDQNKENLKDLEMWFLQGNEFESLNGFPRVPNLKYLDLSKNAIKKLEGFPDSPHLETLNLAENSLESLENLPLLSQLAYLHLENNSLKSLVTENLLETDSIRFPNLVLLNLSNNSLENLRGITKITKDPKRILFNNNPINSFRKMPLDEIIFILQYLTRPCLDSLQISGQEYLKLRNFIENKDDINTWEQINDFYS